MGRIVEWPVVAVDLPGKHGTCLVRIAANRDDRLDIAVQKLRKVPGGVMRDIDADLGHDLDGERMNVARRLAARARHLESVSQCCTQKPFRNMAPAYWAINWLLSSIVSLLKTRPASEPDKKIDFFGAP